MNIIEPDMQTPPGCTCRCFICDSLECTVLAAAGQLDVWMCTKCGTAFTYPQPQNLNDQYCEPYFELYARRRKFRLKRAEKRLRRIELLKKPGRILDIGCSLGYFLEAARTRGWDAYGVEISSYAAGKAVEYGLNIKCGTLEEACYDDNFFDCVTMWDVLEHVPDPKSHMTEVRRVLKPGGVVVIGTPNLAHPIARRKIKTDPSSWRHFKPAEHIFYYTPDSLEILLGQCGFKRVNLPLKVTDSLLRKLSFNDVMVVYGELDDK